MMIALGAKESAMLEVVVVMNWSCKLAVRRI